MLGFSIRPKSLFHVTHWKAGSQWIYRILHTCAPEKTIPQNEALENFQNNKIARGKIHPTLYVTQSEYANSHLPSGKNHRFTVFRDLRDTLISLYFSMKVSHPVIMPLIQEVRDRLNALDMDEGLIYLMDYWPAQCAKIQTSWIDAKEPFVRYEDLLVHDEAILMPLLEKFATVPKKRIKEIIQQFSFENMSKGRKLGDEDVNAHERKGIPNDWENYFSEKVKTEFKHRFGHVLIQSGYAKDNNW